MHKITKISISLSGFIPKSQHYFGKRYAENCLNSIVDFEQDQIKRRDARSSVSMGGEGGPMVKDLSISIQPKCYATSLCEELKARLAKIEKITGLVTLKFRTLLQDLLLQSYWWVLAYYVEIAGGRE